MPVKLFDGTRRRSGAGNSYSPHPSLVSGALGSHVMVALAAAYTGRIATVIVYLNALG